MHACWTHFTQRHKWQLIRFSHFSRPVPHCNIVTPQKKSIFPCHKGSDMCFLGPIRATTPNGILMESACKTASSTSPPLSCHVMSCHVPISTLLHFVITIHNTNVTDRQMNVILVAQASSRVACWSCGVQTENAAGGPTRGHGAHRAD